MPRSATNKKDDRRSGTAPDAITLLKADHAAVKKLFKDYDKLCESKESEEDNKGELATRICLELTVHATIEEEIFYPALREALDDQDLLDEAEVEHASAKDLIGQIEAMSPGDELYDAKVTVLGEYINHHVEEEEGEMFKQARKTGLDLQELGDEMAGRQQELKDELGLGQEDEEQDDAGDDTDGQSSAGKKSRHATNGNRRAA